MAIKLYKMKRKNNNMQNIAIHKDFLKSLFFLNYCTKYSLFPSVWATF